jgi:DNA repair protein RecO (recombination protein O)
VLEHPCADDGVEGLVGSRDLLEVADIGWRLVVLLELQEVRGLVARVREQAPIGSASRASVEHLRARRDQGAPGRSAKLRVAPGRGSEAGPEHASGPTLAAASGGGSTAAVYTGRVARRSYTTEAVVLRSLRFGEADRVLHLYTLDRGRVGAVAKGVRKTKSRFGARLEPLSHVELVLHEGGGELQTVTGADLVSSHRAAREDPYRLAIGLVGLEAMLRLFSEQERNERAFEALTRFLEVLDEAPSTGGEHVLDPLGLSFQLKLLWLSGYLPHLRDCAECGAVEDLVGYSPPAGGVVCRNCGDGARPLSGDGLRGIDAMLRRPLAEAHDVNLTPRAAWEALGLVTSSYEYHGGFRLRTLSTR